MNERNIQLVNRLAAYSFASLAFVAIRDDAQASVVYSDLEPDSLIMGNDTMYLDIDGDGADDMWFWIESKTGSIESSGGALVPYQYRFAYAQGLGVNAIMGKQATFSGYIINSAYRFESGELIADTVPKFTAKARLAGFLSVDGSVIYEGGPWSGADNAFLGLRFKISGATHFAWLRLSVATDGSSIQITELAWDNQVDAAIVAGSTVAIPGNPGSRTSSCIAIAAPSSFNLPFSWKMPPAKFSICRAGRCTTHTLAAPITRLPCNPLPAGYISSPLLTGEPSLQKK